MGYKPMVIFVWDGSGGRPDQSLPPGLGPVDPGFGVEAPVDPGYGIPGRPPRPDQGLPGGGRPPHVDNTLPPIPVLPDNELPPAAQPKPVRPLPDNGFLVLWVPGKGYVAVPVNPARPDQGLPPGQPGQPTQPIAPTPQPKR